MLVKMVYNLIRGRHRRAQCERSERRFWFHVEPGRIEFGYGAQDAAGS